MKAAVMRAVGAPLAIEEIQISTPGAREVLVRTAATGVCNGFHLLPDARSRFFRLAIVAVWIAISATTSGADQRARPELLAVSGDSDTVSVIDPSAGVIERAFKVGSGLRPTGPVAISPDGKRAFVAGARGVYVFDVPAVSLEREIALGYPPTALAAAPVGNALYALADAVDIVDADSGMSLATIVLDSGATGIAFSPDGSHAYVTSFQSVTVIDTLSRTATAVVPVDEVTTGPVVAPDGSRVYIGALNCGGSGPAGKVAPGSGGPTPTITPNRCRPAVEVIDPASNAVIGSIPLFLQPIGLAVSGAALFVASGDDIDEFDAATGQRTGALYVAQARQIVFAPDGHHAYVVGDGIQLIDTAPLGYVTAVPIFGSPTMALTPDGTFAYIADPVGGVLSVLATASNTVVARAVPAFPRDIALTPDGATAYVAANDLLVLDSVTGEVRKHLPVQAVTLAVTPDGQWLYATTAAGIVAISTGSSRITRVSTDTPLGDFAFSRTEPIGFVSGGGVDLIDTAAQHVFASVGLDQAGGVAASPSGGFAYVVASDLSGGLLRLVSPAAARAFDAIALGANVEPSRIAVSPDGAFAYVSAIDRTTNATMVLVVGLTTRKLEDSIPLDYGASEFALDAAAAVLFVADYSAAEPIGGGIEVIDLQSRTLTGRIAVGREALRFAVRQPAPTTASATPTPTPTATGARSPSPTASPVQGREYALIANFGSTPYAPSSVSLIDTATRGVVATIPTGTGTNHIAVTPDGRRAYALNLTSYDISVIDLAARTVTDTLHVFEFPGALALSPDGATLYVSDGNGARLAVVSADTHALRTIVPMTGRGIVAPDPSGGFVYVAGTQTEPYVGSPVVDHGVLSVIDARTGGRLPDIPVGDGPAAVVFSPDGALAYVAATESNFISVIDRRRQIGLRLIDSGPTPRGLAITPDGRTLYAANYGSYSQPETTVSVVDPTGLLPRETVAVGPGPRDIAIGVDGRFAYVAEEFTDSVSVIDTATHEVVGHVGVGDSPVAVVIAQLPSADPMCGGDCNSDGMVSIDELLTGVGMALGEDLSGRCANAFCHANCGPGPSGTPPTVACLIRAVAHALDGCPTAPCESNADCDDGNDCTGDQCSAEGCVNECLCD